MSDQNKRQDASMNDLFPLVPFRSSFKGANGTFFPLVKNVPLIPLVKGTSGNKSYEQLAH